MKTFICNQNCTLREFTDSAYPQAGFCFARLLKNKDIKINGVRVSSNVPVHGGDEIVYYTTPKEEGLATHAVVYEDGNILIADKFSGVSTEGLCAELNTSGDFYAVHRLDRNTCGLICFAKNGEAEKSLVSAFRERAVIKKYLAVCKDNFKNDGGTLTAYLKKDSAAARVSVSASPRAGGAQIVTEYKVKERRGGLALVSVTLHTGRTHQIRAHLAYIGCPVLGDGKYGDGGLNKRFRATRQCLAAHSLEFTSLGGTLGYINGKKFVSGITLSLDNYI